MTAPIAPSEEAGREPRVGTIEQRERILSSAEQLLAVHGYDRVRLRDVAETAGVSIGTVQYHFDTRDRLLRETFEWSSFQIVRDLARAAEACGTPWERTCTLLAHALARPEATRRSVVWIEYCAAATRHADMKPLMRKLHAEWRRPLREALIDGVREGAFRPQSSVEDILDMLMALIDGSEMAVAVEVPNCSPPRMIQLVIGAAAAALGVAAAGRPSTTAAVYQIAPI